MANVLVNEQYLADIADAIRFHTGSGLSYRPREMAQGILDIPVGDKITFTEFIGRQLTGRLVVDAPLIGKYALGYLDGITELDMTATELKDGACIENPALESVTLRNHLTRIGDGAFRYCRKLSNISPISVDEVGSHAFSSCYSLTKIDFVKLDSFEDGIFGNRTNNEINKMALDTIIIRDYPPTLLAPYDGDTNSRPFPDRFLASYTGSDKGYIYVPAAYLENYMLDTNNWYQDFWKQYSYRAIEDYPNI